MLGQRIKNYPAPERVGKGSCAGDSNSVRDENPLPALGHGLPKLGNPGIRNQTSGLIQYLVGPIKMAIPIRVSQDEKAEAGPAAWFAVQPCEFGGRQAGSSASAAACGSLCWHWWFLILVEQDQDSMRGNMK